MLSNEIAKSLAYKQVQVRVFYLDETRLEIAMLYLFKVELKFNE